MQQELIEMLEKVVDHVVFCNGYDQRFTSTCYGINILKEADVLLEKAKNRPTALEVALTEDEIISIKKSSKAKDPAKPWGDSIAFAGDIISALRAKENKL